MTRFHAVFFIKAAWLLCVVLWLGQLGLGLICFDLFGSFR
jgi:hypothetical protein